MVGAGDGGAGGGGGRELFTGLPELSQHATSFTRNRHCVEGT